MTAAVALIAFLFGMVVGMLFYDWLLMRGMDGDE